MAYRVTIARGQRLTASVELTTEDETRVFVDLFRIAGDEADPPRPVFSSDSLPHEFAHEPWRGGEFVLRLQPELLRGGRYRVTLRLEAQLAFPVDGVEMRAVQSLFGVDRDGGRRTHDGVDIFARRGTPVLAASAGVVNRVGITNLGGKVVWVRDPVRGANIYYAHLDSQYVANGAQVQSGDTLGFVGNTGNARTTPPHLHFGVYRRGEGPIDPVPFLRPPLGQLADLTADVGSLGRWVRLRDDGIRLREAPGMRAPIVRELEEHTPLRVLAGSGEYFRVRLPDGSNGYVEARLTESVEEPVASQIAGITGAVRDRPEHDAPVVATLDPGTEVAVLGRFAGYLLVVPPTGRPGWLADAPLQQQEQ
jgi:murein DD-endopeptidase MepM/ murein hydrolase activator NlpD/SH3-like domain-containing protein